MNCIKFYYYMKVNPLTDGTNFVCLFFTKYIVFTCGTNSQEVWVHIIFLNRMTSKLMQRTTFGKNKTNR